MTRFAHSLVLCGCLLAAGPAAAESIKLDSREYKLRLDPERFTDGASLATANRFLKETLTPLIDRGFRRDEVQAEGGFGESETRTIIFRDTGTCLLRDHHYALRERVSIENGKRKREMTLKLRTPDIVIAATSLLGEGEGKLKLEEDVGPALVRTTANAQGRNAFAERRATRSNFSLSVERKGNEPLGTLGDAMKVFKQLRDELQRDGVGFDADTPLVQGDTIEERVFKGAKVDLGKKSDAKLTLSLWYDKPEAQKAKPLLAEISFTYDPGESEEAAQAARRASKLLVAMQGLDGWALPEAEKTAMALPDTCKAGGA